MAKQHCLYQVIIYQVCFFLLQPYMYLVVRTSNNLVIGFPTWVVELLQNQRHLPHELASGEGMISEMLPKILKMTLGDC